MDSSVGQLALALLRALLHIFERRFYLVAGRRCIEFEQTREQASLLRARFFPAARGPSDGTTETARQQYARALLQPAADPEKMKHLHRDLARHFHPDLASDHARRVLRERLLTEVNLAFEDQDLR